MLILTANPQPKPDAGLSSLCLLSVCLSARDAAFLRYWSDRPQRETEGGARRSNGEGGGGSGVLQRLISTGLFLEEQ